MALADTARLIASLELQDKFTGPAKRAESSVTGLDKKVSTLGDTGRRAGAGLGTLVGNLAKIAAVGATITLGAAAVGIAASVRAASDLNEEIDKSAVVFGKAAPEVQKFSENAVAIGLSTAEALGAAGAFGTMFRTIGFADVKAADMSTTMVQLAADMASFNNEDPSDMLDKLRSGLSGEAEPLRRFGVLISEATVKEFAYREGIAKEGAVLTEAQKVQARYGVILEQTALQQGNFADTSDSMANQQRILRGNLQNTAATLGTGLLPAVSRVLKTINELFIDKQPEIRRFGHVLGNVVDDLFSNQNLDRGADKIAGLVDKLAAFDPSKLKLDFGDDDGQVSNIADSIGGIAEQVKGLPWQAIGDAARLLGTGSKALLDAFLGLPPWVQTAVLTGWGLNKLTGGALGGIVGELSKGLIKGVLGIQAAQVNITAANVTGGGGGVGGAPVSGGGRAPTPGRFGGPIATTVKNFGALASVPLTIVAIEQIADFAGDISGSFDTLDGQLDSLPRRNAAELDESIAKVEDAIEVSEQSALGGLLGITDRLKDEKRELEQLRSSQRTEMGRIRTAVLADTRETSSRIKTGFTDNGAKIARMHADTSGHLSQIRATEQSNNARLAAIQAKKTSFSINNTVNVNTEVEFSASAAAIQIRRVTQTTGNQQDFESLN